MASMHTTTINICQSYAINRHRYQRQGQYIKLRRSKTPQSHKMDPSPPIPNLVLEAHFPPEVVMLIATLFLQSVTVIDAAMLDLFRKALVSDELVGKPLRGLIRSIKQIRTTEEPSRHVAIMPATGSFVWKVDISDPVNFRPLERFAYWLDMCGHEPLSLFVGHSSWTMSQADNIACAHVLGKFKKVLHLAYPSERFFSNVVGNNKLYGTLVVNNYRHLRSLEWVPSPGWFPQGVLNDANSLIVKQVGLGDSTYSWSALTTGHSRHVTVRLCAEFVPHQLHLLIRDVMGANRIQTWTHVPPAFKFETPVFPLAPQLDYVRERLPNLRHYTTESRYERVRDIRNNADIVPWATEIATNTRDCLTYAFRKVTAATPEDFHITVKMSIEVLFLSLCPNCLKHVFRSAATDLESHFDVDIIENRQTISWKLIRQPRTEFTVELDASFASCASENGDATVHVITH